jgi:hypothetical protein
MEHLGSFEILTILSFPPHEHMMSLHIFVFSLIYTASILWSSVCISLSSLINFISKNFILFDALVNVIYFLNFLNKFFQILVCWVLSPKFTEFVSQFITVKILHVMSFTSRVFCFFLFKVLSYQLFWFELWVLYWIAVAIEVILVYS